MTKQLPVSLAAFLLLVTAAPAVFAQVAPAAPAAPQAPAAPVIGYGPVLAPAPAVGHASVLAPAAADGLAPAAAALPASAVVAPPPPQDSAPPAPSTPQAAPSAEWPYGFGSVFFQGGNYLGVSVEEVTRENMGRYGLTGEPRGLAVTRVVKGSPAERAGLRESDVILRYDGEPVSSYRKLNRLIDESAPEHNARLTIRRGGGEQEISVTLGRRQGFAQIGEGTELLRAEELRRRAEESRERGENARRRTDDARRRLEELRRNNQGVFSLSYGARRRIGVSTTALGKQLADFFGVAQGRGVLISAVEENSPADKAGLKAGDVITDADGERIEQAGDLSRVLNRRDEGEINLTIVRDRKQRSVKVMPERSEMPYLFEPGAVFGTPVATVTLPTITLPTVQMTLPRVEINLPRVTVTPRVYSLPRVSPATRVRRPTLLQPVL
jgi:serine protease Do